MQLISSENATDTMFTRFDPSKSREILPRLLLRAEL